VILLAMNKNLRTRILEASRHVIYRDKLLYIPVWNLVVQCPVTVMT